MQQKQIAVALCVILLMPVACSNPDSPGEATASTASMASDIDTLASVAPNGRLPTGVRPVSYRVALELDPRRNDFSGEVSIDVSLAEATNRIWLHGKDLDVSDATASTGAGEEISGRYDQALPTGVAAIVFDRDLPAGIVTLKMQYQADFNRNLAGLFKVEERGESYALAKSESIQARSFLPSFDEPGLKATFDLRLRIPAGHEAIGNSPVVERRDSGSGMQELVFATTPPMSTYLLSLAVGPFEIVEKEPIPPNDIRSRPIPLRGVARKGRGRDLAYVLDVTPRMIAIFEQALRQPYPFRKLDIVAAPQWPSGATELSAAITYREQLILVGDDPAEGARLALLRVHAHEIAHMWFGNLVTPPWWDDLWLKEGFATWATPLVLELLEPDAGHGLSAAERVIDAMQLDSLASTRAIREPISDNEDIRSAYDAITYAKSLGVIHMVDQYFGPDTFRPALGRYVESFAGGIADSPAFYRTIAGETRSPELTDTFRAFVEQTGVPLLDVTLRCESGVAPSVTIRQSRYKPLGSPAADGRKRWSIPVCIRGGTERQCLMMSDAEETLQLAAADCPSFVLPNAGGSGYYRWTLDDSAWTALTGSFSDLLPTEALSAVDSAFAAFEAGKLDVVRLLDIVAASSRSDARQVVVAPIPHLEKYVQHYFSPAEKASFLEFARELYQPVVDRNAAGADGDSQLLYAELVSFMALAAHDPDARERLLALAHAFTGFGVDRDPDAMHSDLYEAALTVAVQDSDAGFLPHLVEFRSELDDPLFEKASASAIGRISHPDQIDIVHQLAFDDRLGPREVFDMVGTALSEPALRDLHWDWFRDRFPSIVDRIPAQWQRFTPGMAAGFCDADKLDELRALFDAHGGQVAGYQLGLDQAAEQIGLCMALRDRGTALASGIGAYQVRDTSAVLRDQRRKNNGTHGQAAQHGENAGRAMR